MLRQPPSTAEAPTGDSRIHQEGQVGKVRVDLRVTSVCHFASHLDMASLDEWLPAYRESIKNDGRLPFPAFDGSYDSKLNEIDWQDVMTQTAYRQQYHLSVSGGSESVRSNFSIGYLDNRGIIVSSWSKRLNMRLNTDFNITKWLKSGFSIGFNTGKNKGGGNMINYARIVPTMDYVDQNTGKLMTVPVVYPDGSFGLYFPERCRLHGRALSDQSLCRSAPAGIRQRLG